MAPNYEQEVIDLHDFFQGWLDGTAPNTPDYYARVNTVLADDFTLINPDGTRTTGKQLLDNVRDAHGARVGWRMWTENTQLRLQSGELFVVTYEEWHERDGETTARICTAVLRADANAPNGVVWLHVQETWMDVA